MTCKFWCHCQKTNAFMFKQCLQSVYWFQFFRFWFFIANYRIVHFVAEVVWCSILKLYQFFLDPTRTTLRPGTLPTKNFPVKSIPSTINNTKPCESAEVILKKLLDCSPIPSPNKSSPYSSFEDFNKKILLLKMKN